MTISNLQVYVKFMFSKLQNHFQPDTSISRFFIWNYLCFFIRSLAKILDLIRIYLPHQCLKIIIVMLNYWSKFLILIYVHLCYNHTCCYDLIVGNAENMMHFCFVSPHDCSLFGNKNYYCWYLGVSMAFCFYCGAMVDRTVSCIMISNA